MTATVRLSRKMMETVTTVKDRYQIICANGLSIWLRRKADDLPDAIEAAAQEQKTGEATHIGIIDVQSGLIALTKGNTIEHFRPVLEAKWPGLQKVGLVEMDKAWLNI